MRSLFFAVLVVLFATNALAQPERWPVVVDVADPPARIFAEEGLDNGARQVAAEWEAAAPRIAQQLGLTSPRPVAVYLLHDRSFTAWSRGLLPEWGVGYANWPDGPIALNVGEITAGTKPLALVLRHEISHVYLGQRLEGLRPPTWFVEGVAQAQADEWGFGDTLALVQVASAGALPRLSELVGHFPTGGRRAELAYRISLQAIGELDRRLSDRGGWPALVEATAARGDFDAAFRELVGTPIGVFENELMTKLRGKYGWIAAVAGASTLFTAMTFLFLAGVVRAKLKKRRRLREMEEEEARMAFEEMDRGQQLG